jgi:hypothetical protein
MNLQGKNHLLEQTNNASYRWTWTVSKFIVSATYIIFNIRNMVLNLEWSSEQHAFQSNTPISLACRFHTTVTLSTMSWKSSINLYTLLCWVLALVAVGAVLRDDQFNIKARRVADRVLVISKTRAVYMTFPLTIYSPTYSLCLTQRKFDLTSKIWKSWKTVTESCNIYI